MVQRYPRHFVLLLLVLLGLSPAAQAQIEPAAQYTKLSMAQFMAWTPTGPTAVPANVSRVPLATRQNVLSAQLNPAQSFSHKVNYIPDGMANFAGYLNEQNTFNLYNFTHWQYIDVLTWFDGTVGIPTRPWIETAHRNGVKIIGTVFTNATDVAALVQQDAGGNYIGAQKLVDMANYYGFDGWFFNEESNVSAATATQLMNLLKQLQAIKPAGMEIHWYDAMLPSGAVSYQNTLNTANQRLLQDGSARVSDAIFTNYFWSGATAVNTAVATANSLGRSPFDVYHGADLWPNRSNQSLFTNSAWIDNYFTGGNVAQPKLSLGLFAANLTYNGGFNSFNSNPADYVNFYRTEQRIFSGNDYDITTPDATGWKGLGHYVPVRTVVTSLPFETTFTVGQGKVFANNGVLVQKNWTDMAKQSILPSWQWAKTGTAPVTAGFDFDDAYYGGTSIKLAGSLSGSNNATVKLYQTKLPVGANTNLQLTYKSTAAGFTATRLALYFTDDLANPVLYDIGSGTLPAGQWHTQDVALGTQQGRELAIIGVVATSPTPVAAYQVNLGKLRIVNGSTVPTARPTANFSASATTVITNQAVTFANSSLNASSYVWTFAGATPASSTAVHPTVSYATAGTYAVKLRAENAFGRDSLTRTAYITVVTPASPGGNTSLLFDGVGKYVDAGAINLSGPGLSFECWVKAASFKSGSPFISSIVGIEDGGTNVAMLRFGDAGLTGDQLQFVLNVNGASRKLASVSHLSLNTWYHLAATFDGTAMRIYVNGVLDATLNVNGSVIANAPFSVGRNYANSRVLDGSIDEVRVWKRALSAAEIAANPCLVSPSAPSLEGYWQFNEATGSVAVDATGHGHLGTLVNMVASDWSPLVPTQCANVTAVSPGRALPELQVYVLGNPVRGSQADLEIHGAQGQPISLQLFNTLGALVGEQQLKPSAGIARPSLPMPQGAGLYVLRVSTPRGSTSVKLLRQ
jgi:endo-beta-N-acetylglucosaminidase D